ncbi:MAG: phosphoribosyl 1,2-cyclic phosphate 1,2-diphosphodiesterase [Methanolobus sp.]|nr:phosphoribosyl 1,2-cyclic phosphate 1,2-diphosphodiesterase [Methanolobus sp.]
MIDLHCHTNISDSSMSIHDTIEHAAKKGITHLGITDHDTTIDLKEAISIGEDLGIEIIPGIEISAYDFENNKKVHILGYYPEEHNNAIKNLCDPLVKKRHENGIMMVRKLMDNGYDITVEEVEEYSGISGIYKQHIMHCLMDKGYTDSIYSDLYDKLFLKGDENGTGIAYMSLQYVHYGDAIRAIRSARGIPVIAHIEQFDNYEIMYKMIDEGLLGMEARHPDHDVKAERKAMEFARENELVITAGSDFHGLYAEGEYYLGSYR